jgi:acetyl esterase/lipase
VLFLIGQFTPVLTAWVFKQAIDSSSFAKPGNFATIEDNVIVKQDIVYDEHGTRLDIYSPRNHKAPLPIIMWIHGDGFICLLSLRFKHARLSLAGRILSQGQVGRQARV